MPHKAQLFTLAQLHCGSTLVPGNQDATHALETLYTFSRCKYFNIQGLKDDNTLLTHTLTRHKWNHDTKRLALGQCHDGYYGPTCQPCACNERGGQCTLTGNNTATCVCNPGFTGPACDEPTCPIGKNGRICSAQGVCTLQSHITCKSNTCYINPGRYTLSVKGTTLMNQPAWTLTRKNKRYAISNPNTQQWLDYDANNQQLYLHKHDNDDPHRWTFRYNNKRHPHNGASFFITYDNNHITTHNTVGTTAAPVVVTPITTFKDNTTLINGKYRISIAPGEWRAVHLNTTTLTLCNNKTLCITPKGNTSKLATPLHITLEGNVANTGETSFYIEPVISHYQGTCVCKTPFAGPACEQELANCTTNGVVCSGNGVCDTKEKQCVCKPGYTGTQCEYEQKNCPFFAGKTCSGHGHCNTNGATCTCRTDYTGKACQFKKTNYCGNTICNTQNTGIANPCTSNSNTPPTCPCGSRWTGPHCDTSLYPANPTTHVQCSNKAETMSNCTQTQANLGLCRFGTLSCFCKPHYVGKACQTYIQNDQCKTTNSICNGHGVCHNNTCICFEDFQNSQCQTHTHNACLHCNAARTHYCNNTGICNCRQGFTGTHCETSICEATGGALNPSTALCKCPKNHVFRNGACRKQCEKNPYTHEDCGNDKDNPCNDDGTCSCDGTQWTHHDNTCYHNCNPSRCRYSGGIPECTFGWSNPNAFCTTVTCQNGGVPPDPSATNATHCTCPHPYTGTLCGKTKQQPHKHTKTCSFQMTGPFCNISLCHPSAITTQFGCLCSQPSLDALCTPYCEHGFWRRFKNPIYNTTTTENGLYKDNNGVLFIQRGTLTLTSSENGDVVNIEPARPITRIRFGRCVATQQPEMNSIIVTNASIIPTQPRPAMKNKTNTITTPPTCNCQDSERTTLFIIGLSGSLLVVSTIIVSLLIVIKKKKKN